MCTLPYQKTWRDTMRVRDISNKPMAEAFDEVKENQKSGECVAIKRKEGIVWAVYYTKEDLGKPAGGF